MVRAGDPGSISDSATDVLGDLGLVTSPSVPQFPHQWNEVFRPACVKHFETLAWEALSKCTVLAAPSKLPKGLNELPAMSLSCMERQDCLRAPVSAAIRFLPF